MLELLMHYGYFLLFPIAFAEGPIITVLGGFLASLGYVNLWIAYAVVVAADLSADMTYYAIGRWGRGGIVQRWGKYIGLNTRRVATLEKHFYHHSGKTLLIGKISHGVGVAFLMAAGVAKMPLGKYFWYNVLGTVPKSLVFLLIGYYFGASYNRIGKYVDYTALVFAGFAVILLGVYLLIRRFARKEEVKEELL